MAVINYYQNSKNFSDKNFKEVKNVEKRVQETYSFLLENRIYGNEELKSIFDSRIFELSNMFNSNINIYDVNGNLISSNLKQNEVLHNSLLQQLKSSSEGIIKDSAEIDKKVDILNGYSYFMHYQKRIAIINVQKIVNSHSSFFQSKVLIKQYFLIIIFLMVLSGFMASYISKNLTRKIEEVSEKLQNTNVAYLETPLDYRGHDEIAPLVTSYNNMLKKLKEQKRQLQKTERDEAWKEMAKQVAHEINNPLTPLKLTVQNFQRKYDGNDPENPQKIKNLTQTVIHQIDLISSITKSFSDFAQMPTNTDVEIDIVGTIQKTLDIYPRSEVVFTSNVNYLYHKIDPLYLTRIVTNIVKNASQAIPTTREKKINVNLLDKENSFLISIQDNGNGIPLELQHKVFEPKFTTKSSGMGLGLSMVKKIVEDYNGKIWFESKISDGTIFYVQFNKEQS